MFLNYSLLEKTGNLVAVNLRTMNKWQLWDDWTGFGWFGLDGLDGWFGSVCTKLLEHFRSKYPKGMAKMIPILSAGCISYHWCRVEMRAWWIVDCSKNCLVLTTSFSKLLVRRSPHSCLSPPQPFAGNSLSGVTLLQFNANVKFFSVYSSVTKFWYEIITITRRFAPSLPKFFSCIYEAKIRIRSFTEIAFWNVVFRLFFWKIDSNVLSSGASTRTLSRLRLHRIKICTLCKICRLHATGWASDRFKLWISEVEG